MQLNPQFIIHIIDIEELDYDSSTGDIIQPVSMIHYEFSAPSEGGEKSRIGIVDSPVTGKSRPVDGKYPKTIEETGLSARDFAQILGEQIAENIEDKKIVLSYMGVEPEENNANKWIYDLSANLVEQIVEESYDSIKESNDEETGINSQRIVSWMDKVKDHGARNTEGTLTAVMVEPGENPHIPGVRQ